MINRKNNKTKRHNLILVLLIILAITGCSNDVTTTESSAEVITEVSTEEATTETATLAEVEAEKKTVLTESEIKVIEAELDLLFERILERLVKKTESHDVQYELNQFVKESNKEIEYLYFGTASDDFWISPETVMPENYNFTERPPYQNAVSEGIYVPDGNLDGMTGRVLYTVTKAYLVDGEIFGVVGIDFYGE